MASPACPKRTARSRRSSRPKKFKAYEIGYFHIDIAELRYEGGKGFLYVAVDRTSKLVFARIYRKATKLAAAAFLKVLVKTVPYRIHTVLTDNGVQFVQHARGGNPGWLIHIFDRVCQENGIEHRLTKPYHPWTNGQAERMVRTIKEATVKSFHYDIPPFSRTLLVSPPYSFRLPRG